MSSRSKTGRAVIPQRSSGRRRVESILEAAELVFSEKGYDGATLTEVASRAGANIASLYRFFPNKAALAESVIQRGMKIFGNEFDVLEREAPGITTESLVRRILYMMNTQHHEARAFCTLMADDAQSDMSVTRAGLWAVERIVSVLRLHWPRGDAGQSLQDVAILLLNGMKLMTAMTVDETAPSSPGAVQELEIMFRVYITQKLGEPNPPAGGTT
ncbi:TetR/AcrR family transcriptional regulator [Acidiphilium iwatense]|uniref:TetR/AcrR family transcriptional regulator n=1 Tax=Acidiphilium iwatense TaxID=768198 RepID=A0ABS9DX55_9PROT|nr:TetR/AcrR family transcriptional regulator [Acidiphilium iwatense]MCF3947310.1 TetR/AcrR family transcriptional regulator [Acidiphilium iwatense]